MFPVLVAKGLTQECLLGLDFLVKYEYIIDMQERILKQGNSNIIPFSLSLCDFQGGNLPLCHVICTYTITIPGNHQMEISVCFSSPDSTTLKDTYVGILDPVMTFVSKRGILVAHSIHTVSLPSGTSVVRVINPSPTSTTIYQNEKIGTVQSIS